MSVNLKMYIGRLLIKTMELDYTGLNTADEKQKYQEQSSIDMFRKCRYIPRETKPVFYIDCVPSKGNELTERDLEYALDKETRDKIDNKIIDQD